MQKKMNIKKGDTVVIIAGNSKGQQGRVLEVIRKNDRAIVEGVNMLSKHTKADKNAPQGGIIKREGSIHVSNVMLVDPTTGKPTRIGRREGADGKLVRYAKKSGEEIK
jgi:large subunit ribosomal protein L24